MSLSRVSSCIHGSDFGNWAHRKQTDANANPSTTNIRDVRTQIQEDVHKQNTKQNMLISTIDQDRSFEFFSIEREKQGLTGQDLSIAVNNYSSQGSLQTYQILRSHGELQFTKTLVKISEQICSAFSKNKCQGAARKTKCKIMAQATACFSACFLEIGLSSAPKAPQQDKAGLRLNASPRPAKLACLSKLGNCLTFFFYKCQLQAEAFSRAEVEA